MRRQRALFTFGNAGVALPLVVASILSHVVVGGIICAQPAASALPAKSDLVSQPTIRSNMVPGDWSLESIRGGEGGKSPFKAATDAIASRFRKNKKRGKGNKGDDPALKEQVDQLATKLSSVSLSSPLAPLIAESHAKDGGDQVPLKEKVDKIASKLASGQSPSSVRSSPLAKMLGTLPSEPSSPVQSSKEAGKGEAVAKGANAEATGHERTTAGKTQPAKQKEAHTGANVDQQLQNADEEGRQPSNEKKLENERRQARQAEELKAREQGREKKETEENNRMAAEIKARKERAAQEEKQKETEERARKAAEEAEKAKIGEQKRAKEEEEKAKTAEQQRLKEEEEKAQEQKRLKEEAAAKAKAAEQQRKEEAMKKKVEDAEAARFKEEEAKAEQAKAAEQNQKQEQEANATAEQSAHEARAAAMARRAKAEATTADDSTRTDSVVTGAADAGEGRAKAPTTTNSASAAPSFDAASTPPASNPQSPAAAAAAARAARMARMAAQEEKEKRVALAEETKTGGLAPAPAAQESTAGPSLEFLSRGSSEADEERRRAMQAERGNELIGMEGRGARLAAKTMRSAEPKEDSNEAGNHSPAVKTELRAAAAGGSSSGGKSAAGSCGAAAGGAGGGMTPMAAAAAARAARMAKGSQADAKSSTPGGPGVCVGQPSAGGGAGGSVAKRAAGSDHEGTDSEGQAPAAKRKVPLGTGLRAAKPAGEAESAASLRAGDGTSGADVRGKAAAVISGEGRNQEKAKATTGVLERGGGRDAAGASMQNTVAGGADLESEKAVAAGKGERARSTEAVIGDNTGTERKRDGGGEVGDGDAPVNGDGAEAQLAQVADALSKLCDPLPPELVDEEDEADGERMEVPAGKAVKQLLTVQETLDATRKELKTIIEAAKKKSKSEGGEQTEDKPQEDGVYVSRLQDEPLYRAPTISVPGECAEVDEAVALVGPDGEVVVNGGAEHTWEGTAGFGAIEQVGGEDEVDDGEQDAEGVVGEKPNETDSTAGRSIRLRGVHSPELVGRWMWGKGARGNLESLSLSHHAEHFYMPTLDVWHGPWTIKDCRVESRGGCAMVCMEEAEVECGRCEIGGKGDADDAAADAMVVTGRGKVSLRQCKVRNARGVAGVPAGGGKIGNGGGLTVLGTGTVRVYESYFHHAARAVAVDEEATVEVRDSAFEELEDGVFMAGEDAEKASLRFFGNGAMANPWVGDSRPGEVEGEDNEFFVPEKNMPLE